MTTERSQEVLNKGIEAAKTWMNSIRFLNRPEYKRDFNDLYNKAEDELFDIFNAMEDKDFDGIKLNSSVLIGTLSEIIEYAELRADIKKKKWTIKQELEERQ
jgi:hypothetical protein